MTTPASAEAGRDLAAQRRRFLAHCLVGTHPARGGPSEAEWLELVALARVEGVAPLLDRALGAHGGSNAPPAAREALRAEYVETVYESLIYEAARVRLCRRLSDRSIPAILLKGAGLAFTSYEDPATRPMRDIDLLVPESRLEEAARCVEEDGFGYFYPRQREERCGIRRSGRVYEHPASGTVVELHWTLKPLGTRPAEALAEIWSGARTGPDATARVMRFGHAIPLLCAHSTLEHAYARLLWLHDLHRVLLATDAGEAALACDSATRWRLAPCTAVTLLCVRDLFGTPLPGGLDIWASEQASRDSMQARVATLALTPGLVERPDADLRSQAMTSGWSLLRLLFPSPGAVRERFRLAEHESVLPAYLALAARRLRNIPVHLDRLRRILKRPRTALQPPQRSSPQHTTRREERTHRG